MSRPGPESKSPKQVILHPIVCAIYPVVFLYTANQKFFDFSMVPAPALTVAAAAALVWALATRLSGDARLGAIFTTVPLLAFFSYGSLERVFRSDGASDTWTLLICACVAVACLAPIVLLKRRHLIDQVTYAFNVVSLILVAGPLFQVGMWQLGVASARSEAPRKAEAPQTKPAGPNAPDIYYFVLDAYGRADVLESDYQFDNSGIIADLEQRGFYVADQATANYPYTVPSITSTLNVDYLQNLLSPDLGEFPGRVFLHERMQGSVAVNALRGAGYRIVSFTSPYAEVDIGPTDAEFRKWWFPNEFVIGLIGMTPVSSIMTSLGSPLFFDVHRDRLLYPFEQMPQVAAMDGPKFVFAHILYGHPPFVLDAEGQPIATDWNYTWDDGSDLLAENAAKRKRYVEGYRGQIEYLNSRLRQTIDSILAKSKRPPIIIVHGDHGPGSHYSNDSLAKTDLRERFSIFYAALLPGEGKDDLYPSISPINGMRIVLNHSLGMHLPHIEDASYFNGFSTPYVFTRIDDDRLRVAR